MCIRDRGIIHGINTNVNDVELTNIMYHVKSAKFTDSGVRSLNTTMVEGPPTSLSTPALRTYLCYPSIRSYASSISSANLYVSGIYTKNSILFKTHAVPKIYAKYTCVPLNGLDVHAVSKRWTVKLSHMFCVSIPRPDLRGVVPFYFPPNVFGQMMSKFR